MQKKQVPRSTDQESGRGADGIREHLGALGKVRLALVVPGHLATDAAEEGANRLEGRLVEHELATEGRGERLGGEVVARGPETAGDEHVVAALRGAPEGVDHVVRVVAHGGLVARLDVEAQQALREEGLVAVDDLAAQQLVADGEDLGPGRRAHGPTHSEGDAQDETAEDPGEDVVQHHAGAAGEAALGPGDGGRLPDVEQPEQQEAREQPRR